MAMDIAEDPEISLSVPLKPLFEEFTCPVCFNVIDDCYMTTCGHNFCSECIKECINRKPQCPVCNAALTKQQLIKNKHIDRLILILQQEKEKASKAYFERLIQSTPKLDDNQNHAKSQPEDNLLNNKNVKLSPIEELFHRHMKKSLLSYEEYYQKMKQKYEKTLEDLKNQYTKKMMDTREKYESKAKNDSTNSEKYKSRMNQKVSTLKSEYEEKSKQLTRSFEESVQLLLFSYETYLKNVVPAPSFLPVSLNIHIQSKNIHFKNVLVKPTDNVKDIKRYLIEQFDKLNNPIKEFTSENIFLLKKRFGDASKNNSNNVPVDLMSSQEETVVLQDEERPILQYNPEPGSELVVLGPLKVLSDEPKQCFRDIFVKGKDLLMDYYTCKDCKFNWICKNCAETCHKGHAINDYIMGHKAKWACCYCAKNGKCLLKKK
jgi:hypothetical protein